MGECKVSLMSVATSRRSERGKMGLIASSDGILTLADTQVTWAFAEAEGGALQAGKGTLVDGLDRQIGIGEDGDDHSGDFSMVVADLVQNLYRRNPASADR